MTLSTLQDLMTVAQARAPRPAEGVIEGRIAFSGPATKPELMTARVELPVLHIVPTRRTFAAVNSEQLGLRNAEPIVLEYGSRVLHVKNAHMVGRETDLKVTGS